MKNKTKIDAGEMLRLCGITDEQDIANYSWMLTQGLSDEQHSRKIKSIIQNLTEAVDGYNMLGELDITKIREASRIIESLIVIKEKSTREVLNEIEDKQSDPNRIIYKYKLKCFPSLMKASEGLEKGFYIVTADANVGKTAFLCQLTNDLLTSNDGASIKILFISLDDGKDDILKRLIANMTFIIGNNSADASTINSTARYYDFYDEFDNKWRVNPKATRLKKMATTIISENVNANRLLITDSSHNLNSIRNAVIEAGTKNLVVMIDGVYNVKTGLTGNEHDDCVSAGIKHLARDFKIPFFCIKDLKKPPEGKREITLHDLKGSGSWGYNASFVASLSNDEGRIKMFISKNKKSDFKSRSVYYNFIPAKNVYQELSE